MRHFLRLNPGSLDPFREGVCVCVLEYFSISVLSEILLCRQAKIKFTHRAERAAEGERAIERERDGGGNPVTQ